MVRFCRLLFHLAGRVCLPMVAGPPGHGKTLLAQQLQHMLGVPYLFEDCSKLHHIVDLLGATGMHIRLGMP